MARISLVKVILIFMVGVVLALAWLAGPNLAARVEGVEAQYTVAGAAPQAPNIPPLPFSPTGTVKNGGANVPNGTIIAAYCGGVKYVETPSVIVLDPPESWYAMDIPGDDPGTGPVEGCTPLQMVTFTIGGQAAFQTVPWVQGSALLDLTVDEPNPGIELQKYTNGQDADTPDGPAILAGTTVTWTYTFTNTGNVSLNEVILVDDLGPGGPDQLVCAVERLAPNSSQDCTLTGTAVVGAYMNTAVISGTFGTTTYTDSDVSHYFGADPALDLEKSTNGEDADSPSGPQILIGDPVTWTYTVTNTGNVTLSNIQVSDDEKVDGSFLNVCLIDELAPGSSASCERVGTAVAGQYANLGKAAAVFSGVTFSDTDLSHYFGTTDESFVYLPAIIR